MIGLSAALLLLASGHIAGTSGIIAGLVPSADNRHDRGWRWAFMAGMWAVGAYVAILQPSAAGTSPAPLIAVAIAGLLVGFGTRLARGCTSGHGVCGLGRFSLPSLIAVLTFMATAIATTTAVRVLGGWQ